jgi:hypothetical protein
MTWVRWWDLRRDERKMRRWWLHEVSNKVVRLEFCLAKFTSFVRFLLNGPKKVRLRKDVYEKSFINGPRNKIGLEKFEKIDS